LSLILLFFNKLKVIKHQFGHKKIKLKKIDEQNKK